MARGKPAGGHRKRGRLNNRNPTTVRTRRSRADGPARPGRACELCEGGYCPDHDEEEEER